MRYLVINEEKARLAGLPMLGRWMKNGMAVCTEKECMALPIAEGKTLEQTAEALGGYATDLARVKELLQENYWEIKLNAI